MNTKSSGSVSAEYAIKKYTIGLPGLLIGLFKSEDSLQIKDSLFSKQVLFISKDDYQLYKNYLCKKKKRQRLEISELYLKDNFVLSLHSNILVVSLYH